MLEGKQRWVCEECDGICGDDDVLIAPNPFDPKYIISGCPHCREPNCLTAACADIHCKSRAGGGYPKAFGYRWLWLCWNHSPDNADGEFPEVAQ